MIIRNNWTITLHCLCNTRSFHPIPNLYVEFYSFLFIVQHSTFPFFRDTPCCMRVSPPAAWSALTPPSRWPRPSPSRLWRPRRHHTRTRQARWAKIDIIGAKRIISTERKFKCSRFVRSALGLTPNCVKGVWHPERAVRISKQWASPTQPVNTIKVWHQH